MKNKFSIIVILLFTAGFFINSCSKDNIKEDKNRGKLTVYIDEDLFPLYEEPLKWYPDIYKNVQYEFVKVHSREAMRKLLSENKEPVVIARGYLEDERIAMEQNGVTRLQMKLAKDGLVFFTKPGFPIDTLNVNQISKLLTDPSYSLKSQFPKALTFEPEFVTVGLNSSVWANLQMLAAEGKEIKKEFKHFSTIDSVKDYIKSNPNAIGVTYLGYIHKNPEFVGIRIGFFHKDGKREIPQIVHPGWVVNGRYPFVVEYYCYLLAEKQNLPSYFATYLQKNEKVTKFLFDKGVIPDHSKITLEMQ